MDVVRKLSPIKLIDTYFFPDGSNIQKKSHALIAYDSEGSSVFIPGGLKNIEIMPWDFGKDQQEQEKQH